ncbi:MAG: hypothetical protein U1E77_10145 [Inhella sp.]
MRAALVLFGLIAAGWAQAEIAEIRWDAQGRATQTFNVAPGTFAEYCGKLTKDQTVRWSFEAGAPLDFNIHYHAGKAVEYPVKAKGVAAQQGELKVALDQDYCWMWSNKGGVGVTLKVQLER